MEAILDSSFVLSCIRKRIDFLTQLEEQGFLIRIPREVMQEMKDLSKKPNVSHEDRTAINVALDLIEKRKIKKIRLGSKGVDEGLIEKGRQGYFIATLDNGIKNKIDKKIVIFASKGNVGIG